MPELDLRAGRGGKSPARELRKDGRHADPLKNEGWVFPPSFVHEQLHTSPHHLLVLDTTGDSMAPTIVSGERVIIDTSHKTPTPDGLYAIRDTFNCIVVKRLQVLRSSRPPRVKIISDNTSLPSEEAPLGELEIVGKVLCCLKLFLKTRALPSKAVISASGSWKLEMNTDQPAVGLTTRMCSRAAASASPPTVRPSSNPRRADSSGTAPPRAGFPRRTTA